MRIISNSDISVDNWKSFFSENPYASPFQSYDFYCLFNATSGLSAEAFAVIDKNRILALAVVTLQKETGIAALFSRRGIIYGGPLADPESPDALDYLITHMTRAFRNRIIYLETRNLHDYSAFKEIFIKNRWKYVPYLNYIVKVHGNDEMKKTVSDSRIRQINRAKSNGVLWREAANIGDVKDFYKLLSDLYKKKVKKPLLPWEFFKLSYEMRFGVFLVVSYKERIIGGIMCPILKGKAIYEFYVCGNDSENRNQYPSIMANWAAIEYAVKNDIPTFDFMGAGKPSEGYGVRDFKARFGGVPVEYGRFLRVLNPALYSIGTIGLKYWALRSK